MRLKLKKNWIPVWLKKPTDFRPTTKMPNFRLNDEQIKAISAYLWQSALTDPLPKHPAATRLMEKNSSKRGAVWHAIPLERATKYRVALLPQI